LPQSGREPADAPCLEEYFNTPDQVPPPELLTAVCLPLRPA
jgi:AraC family transcriptional regulator